MLGVLRQTLNRRLIYQQYSKILRIQSSINYIKQMRFSKIWGDQQYIQQNVTIMHQKQNFVSLQIPTEIDTDQFLQGKVLIISGTDFNQKQQLVKCLQEKVNIQYINILKSDQEITRDEQPIEIIQKQIKNINHQGVIIDGFPNTKEQANTLQNLLMEYDLELYSILHFEKLEQANDNYEALNHLKNNTQCYLNCIPQFEHFNETVDYVLNYLNAKRLAGQIIQENSISKLKDQLHRGRRDFDVLALEFRDQALKENKHKRTGLMRRFVYLQTENNNKYQEFVEFFDSYGIEVLQIPQNLPEEFLLSLLRCREADLVPLSILKETSNLYRPHSQFLSSFRHGVKAHNISELEVLTLSKDNITMRKLNYSYNIKGTINLNKKVTDEPVFSWDDIFMIDELGKTYHELKKSKLKHSARNMVLSKYSEDFIHYKKPKDLKFIPLKPQRAIDFGVSVVNFVETNQYYNNELSVEYGFRNLLNNVLNKGVFFRAAQNRRQNNYWNPGLNGGIPLTQKKDGIHELTFMAHDFGHFGLPDLIYTGNNSFSHRRAYIIWRMSSEALTMSLADMLFIDSLVKTGVQYDFNKRRIYPLFQQLNTDFTNKSTYVDNLKKLMKANYYYCLKGDDSLYRQMMSQNDQADFSMLENFKEKYMPFFVEDFKWTDHNYDNMVQQSEYIRRWWKDVEPIRQYSGIQFTTIDEFLNDFQENCGLADLNYVLDKIFEIIFEKHIKEMLNKQHQLLPREETLKRGFFRYMTGQLAIFSKFHYVPESTPIKNQIISMLQSKFNSELTLNDIESIRVVYEEFLKVLVDRTLISSDDEATYKEIYPLFNPFYVAYDHDLAEYENLNTISTKILSYTNHRQKQMKIVENVTGHPLNEQDKNFISRMSDLIELSNGQIEDGVFVIKPGVTLLANTNFQDNIGSNDILSKIQENPDILGDLVGVTVLVSGISIETALELVAHKELSIARLTTSKTNAMNFPLLRVYGEEQYQSQQKEYLLKLIKFRQTFEQSYQPRIKWENGTEIFNIFNSGNKCTTLTFSTTLKHLHNIFIGRLATTGNETEVKEIMQNINQIVTQLYPNIIPNVNIYQTMQNDAKYKSNQTFNSTLIQDTNTHNNLILWAKGQINSNSNVIPGIIILGTSTLTPNAKDIFQQLHINNEVSDTCQLAEFRSRLTYLAFNKTHKTKEDAQRYLNKIITQHKHYSIVAGTSVNVLFAGVQSSFIQLLYPIIAECLGSLHIIAQDQQTTLHSIIVTTNLKEWHKILNKISNNKSQEFHPLGYLLANTLNLRFPEIILPLNHYFQNS